MIPSAFFSLAMTAPNRQLGFRRVVVAHVGMLAILAFVLDRANLPPVLTTVAYATLILGIVEGAALIGWRLTQLPKSQALEFLLVSSLQPKPVFAAEAVVGILRFALVALSGLPVLIVMRMNGLILPSDVIPLMVIPLTWGILAGLLLTVWTYESPKVRRVGELFALVGVVVYLVIGVLAGERLRFWLQAAPESVGRPMFEALQWFHGHNPFGVLQYWFDPRRSPEVAWERFTSLVVMSWLAIGLLGIRGAFRLKGHFQDRHYRPIDSSRRDQSEFIGDRPLSWWAARRVMEYSGRSNLWLAGGFCVLYAAFIVAGDRWPAWMGKSAFTFFEAVGGAPMLVAAMVVLSAVPAAFQYGLWDANPQDRCRRLELLLLTDLAGRDYWHAACAAAWRRGRGYVVVALMLGGALAISGRATPAQVVGSFGAAVVMWGFSFAVGFRAFATGAQANGLGSVLTLGMPLIAWAALRAGQPWLAALTPPGAVYLALAYPLSWAWAFGTIFMGAVALTVGRFSLAGCDLNLRAWYDRNQGQKALV